MNDTEVLTLTSSLHSYKIVFARRARGDRVEVWLGSDDTPEALAHIRGVLIQELTASGADELVRAAKYKKHFDGRREEKKQAKENQANGLQVPGGSGSGSASPLPSPLLTTPTAGFDDRDTQALLAQQQQQQQQERQQQQQREREREQAREQERIMQLGKERLEKERAEKDRLRDERVRALAAAAMAAAEAKHQQQLQQQLEREQQQ